MHGAAGMHRLGGQRRERGVERKVEEEEGGDRGVGGRRKRRRKEEKGAPYLHGLDGIVGVLHGADLIVDALVRQQQLVEDVQSAGPVANRLQRHDRSVSCEERREALHTGGPVAAGAVRTHSLSLLLSHTLSFNTYAVLLPHHPYHPTCLCSCLRCLARTLHTHTRERTRAQVTARGPVR